MNSLECSTQAERYATQECHTELVDQAKNASSRHIACSERMVPHASPIHDDADRSTLNRKDTFSIIPMSPMYQYHLVIINSKLTVPDLEDKS